MVRESLFFRNKSLTKKKKQNQFSPPAVITLNNCRDEEEEEEKKKRFNQIFYFAFQRLNSKEWKFKSEIW